MKKVAEPLTIIKQIASEVRDHKPENFEEKRGLS